MKRLFRWGRSTANQTGLLDRATNELNRKIERLAQTGDQRLAQSYAGAPEIWLSELGHLDGLQYSPPHMSSLRHEAEYLLESLDEMVDGEAVPDWTLTNPDVMRAMAFGVAWEVCVPASASMTLQWGIYMSLIAQHGLKTKAPLY